MSLRTPRRTKIRSADVHVGIAMRITALQTEFVGWWLCPTELSGHSIMVGRSRHPTVSDFRGRQNEPAFLQRTHPEHWYSTPE